MHSYQHILRVQDLHNACEHGKISPRELAERVSRELNRAPFQGDAEFDRLFILLRYVETRADYNRVLKQIDNFGRFQNRLWVGAFGLRSDSADVQA